MSQRIKKLAEQVYGSAHDDDFKFAELIVKECIFVINEPNGVGDDDVIRITRDVKKHFFGEGV